MHRLASVDDEIEQNLFDLPANDRSFGPALKMLLDFDLMLAEVLVGQDKRFFDKRNQVGQFAVRCTIAGKTQHAGDDDGSALAPLEDFLERLLLGCIGAFRAQAELGVVDDRGQDVVEFVRHAGGKGADAAQALGAEKLFAQLFGFRGDRQDFVADHAPSPPMF